MTNFGSYIVRNFSWSGWKSVQVSKNLVTQHDDDGTVYTVYGYDGPEVLICTIWKGTVPDGVLASGVSQEQNDAALVDFETRYKPKSNKPISARTIDGKSVQSVWPTEGSKKTFVTCDWTDRTTWYSTATRHLDQVASCINVPIRTQYALPSGSVIDTYHGRITGEDVLKDSGGNSFRVQVKVNGTASIEQDPHYGSGGDFVLDYESGVITFSSMKQASDVVTATCHYGKSSLYVLRPDTGKVLKVKDVEVQFAKDIHLTDSVKFQAYGKVECFAPYLCPSPYPSGTLIPLGSPSVYKSMSDYINEANGAYPSIPKMLPSLTPDWRQLPVDMITFPWHYSAMLELDSSKGMEVRIFLEHDTPFSGSTATATFYCLSVDA